MRVRVRVKDTVLVSDAIVNNELSAEQSGAWQLAMDECEPGSAGGQ